MKGKKLEKIVRILLLFIVMAIVVWAFKAGSFDFMMNNPGDLLYLGGQHIRLVAISSLFAILIAVPLGIIITRPKYKKYDWIVINFANVGQTIPTLAILALIMSYLGLGWQTAVFALWFNSLLPILRNTVAGIESVNRSILDAGEGMGMTRKQILWKLEITNALPIILAGIRTSIVINVGSAALAFLIGGGGLGDLIFTGIAMSDTGIMLSGAIPVIFLAIFLDFILGMFEKVVVSKGIQRNLEAA
ncbi:ABC-type proline/glycine betaine transport system, permease component [Schinkia azotoformans MEV2011]|uniref:ABC-type proline/glycine betaine transport system, permease component n=1 Tax=Schinkia azotoformans MEV2011 TaxID=1348973 RepID=A0A072NGC6_SCHAZ|nr:ABC transporter permease [Schinkia azotoformans]KEF36307.1 ABC-type proline/glycine betaine transport system, permease component [Schinkia azotoformans MEV2011]MEC1696700.1 ABC transporter permease [Schinkia azotoformans]MEC1720658.1 ABC transporter permease [Schinkia azotoformans]MEC1723646.1 ABC transporter permease [Schinkia azotoformans]MEC1743231.1 ABC transporter permease [Schinkia azotoformans]